jgi:malonate transporter and related proteins
MYDAIIPVFLVIALGAAIRHFAWLTDDFFTSMEKFSYNVAFPALLFSSTARLSFDSHQVADLALATLVPTILVFALCLALLSGWAGMSKASCSSVLQGVMRPNSYFGIAVSGLLFEPKTAALVMLALSLCLPVVNVIAIVMLSWWSGTKTTVPAVLKTLASNPIILATLAGCLVSIAGLNLPSSLQGFLEILGKSALALGLLSVGGGLVFAREGLRPMALGLTSFVKLIALPLVAAKVCILFGVAGAVALAGCFYCALPTAPNAYILAKQMGGDARLMASLVSVQTLLAALTIPLSKHFLMWLA